MMDGSLLLVPRVHYVLADNCGCGQLLMARCAISAAITHRPSPVLRPAHRPWPEATPARRHRNYAPNRKLVPLAPSPDNVVGHLM